MQVARRISRGFPYRKSSPYRGLLLILRYSARDPFRDLYRDRVAERAVAGTVHPFGKPCKVSHSVGVRRRTDKVFARLGAESFVVSTRSLASVPHIFGDGVHCVVSLPDSARIVSQGVSDLSGRVASDSRAVRKWGGNTRPRFSARRKIPLAARGVKKNRGGTRLSKTSDKEHSAASLGHSEVAAVEHAPRYPIPAFDHENAEDFRKVSSSVGRKKSGNILEHKPSGSKLLQDSRKLVKESSA